MPLEQPWRAVVGEVGERHGPRDSLYWLLPLECGHNVERRARYRMTSTTTDTGSRRRHLPRDRADAFPPPVTARCEECPATHDRLAPPEVNP
jgi:hypothetical protein